MQRPEIDVPLYAIGASRSGFPQVEQGWTYRCQTEQECAQVRQQMVTFLAAAVGMSIMAPVALVATPAMVAGGTTLTYQAASWIASSPLRTAVFNNTLETAFSCATAGCTAQSAAGSVLLGTVIDSPASFVQFSAASTSVTSSIPKIRVSRSQYGEAAEHIADAQAYGYPSVLTIDRPNTSSRRREALNDVPILPGTHRDEYPMAMFEEGGAHASVRPINPHDNLSCGAYIGSQCLPYPNGTQVEIVVVP